MNSFFKLKIMWFFERKSFKEIDNGLSTEHLESFSMFCWPNKLFDFSGRKLYFDILRNFK